MLDQGILTMLLRLALQWIGGALVAKGVMDDGSWQQVAGAAMTLSGVGASLYARIQLQRAAAAKGIAATQNVMPTVAQVDAVLGR